MKEPINSIEKVNLLLHRSIRYSYRKRTCHCCPTICCELLLSFLIISLLCLLRYTINKSFPITNSTSIEWTETYSSDDISIYLTNDLILQPKTNETDDLVRLATDRLNFRTISISYVIWPWKSSNLFFLLLLRNDINSLDQNNSHNTIIIRFQSNTSLRTSSHLSCKR